MTLKNHILLTRWPSYGLLAHELVHCYQYLRDGFWVFLAKYLLTAWLPWRQRPYEAEAITKAKAVYDDPELDANKAEL